AEPPHYGRSLAYSTLMDHSSALANMAESQGQLMHNKRNGRYDDDYSAYQEQKKPMIGYPTKSLTQRRPLSARSYSTETYGASQARPVSARPTMAALLEKMPPDYTLATCPEKPSVEDTIKVRPGVQQKPDDITSKMPADWRQQLLRHIEAKRLDRARPVSARPTMAALLEKMPPDYTLATCPEKPSVEDTIKVRPGVQQKPDDITSKMPADWRQQLLRHIEAKRLDRTPQQGAMLDNDQEGGDSQQPVGSLLPGQAGTCPPDNIMKK
ncbi:hypothetical protein CRUP_024348, partial [Coryphaenoides rupestris]